jgi:hypothetical protein
VWKETQPKHFCPSVMLTGLGLRSGT